jgi:capsular polysaccharide biosynthesis protein
MSTSRDRFAVIEPRTLPGDEGNLPAAPRAVAASIPRRNRPLLRIFIALVAGLVAAAVVYQVCSSLPVKYESSATLRVRAPGGAGSSDNVLAANELASQYAQYVKSAGVINPAAERTGVPAGELRDAVTAGTAGDQNVLNIKVSADTPEAARTQANAVSAAFIRFVRRVEQSDRDAVIAQIDQQLEPIEEDIARERRALDRLARDDSTSSQSLAATRQTLLQSLLTQRDRLQAQSIEVSSRLPAVETLSPAGLGSKSSPKPGLYAAIAFLVVFLVVADGLRRWRRLG